MEGEGEKTERIAEKGFARGNKEKDGKEGLRIKRGEEKQRETEVEYEKEETKKE